MASILKTKTQQTNLFNTTSYCGPSQLLPIYNNSKGRFLYIPQRRQPAKTKKPVLTNALRSVSGDDASRNAQTNAYAQMP
jgi:hypothetical protein